MIPDLLADFGGALQREFAGNSARATLHELRTAIHHNQAFLSRHPTSLFQVLHNRLAWRADETQAMFFRAAPATPKTQGVQIPELQSLLRRWITQKLEVSGPFTIAASLRPPQHSNDTAQSIGSFDTAILSLYFTQEPSALVAVTTREVADAVRDGKSVRGDIGVFDPESGVELFPPLEVGSTVTATGLSPDARTLVIGDSKGQVYVIDAINREILEAFDSGHGIVGHRKVKVVPISETKGFNLSNWSRPQLLSSEEAQARDKAVQGLPWSGEYVEHYEGEKQKIHHVIWLKGGSQFGTLDLQGTLRIWSISKFKLVSHLDTSGFPEVPGEIVDGAAIARSDILFCCKGAYLCSFDHSSLQLMQLLQVDERTGFSSRSGFRLSHNDRFLVVTGSGHNGVVTCWDTSNLQMRWKLTDPLPRLFQSAAFSMDDEWIFLGTTSGDIVVVDTATGQIIAEQIAVIGTSITTIRCSLDGTLAIGASDGQIRLIAVESLIKGAQLKGHRDHINEIAIVPRSGLVLTASRDRTAMLWDITDLANPIVLQGHGEEVLCVAVTKEQDIAATGGYDGVILWQLPGGQMIGKRSVPGATNSPVPGTAHSLAFSPNRTWLGGAGSERNACVWFLEGDEVLPFRTFYTDVDSVHEVVFDSSGDFLFALHSGSVIDGWRIRDGKQVLKDRLPWTETHGWKQAQRPPYEWSSEFRLWKDNLDLAIWRETGIIGWWSSRGEWIEAVTPTRFVIWQGGSALEFVEIREFGWE